MTDEPTKPRRWYQFSLRRLLVLPIAIAALAVVVAAITPGTNVPIEGAPLYSFLYAFRSNDPADWTVGAVVCSVYLVVFLAAVLRPNPLTIILALLAVAVWVAAGFAMARCAAC